MGFLKVQEMWYSRKGCEELENRLDVLVDDRGTIEMLKIANTHGEVHLFLVHVVSEAEVLLVLGDGVEIEGVEGNVKDGGVEPEGVKYNVEDGGDVEPKKVLKLTLRMVLVWTFDHHGIMIWKLWQKYLISTMVLFSMYKV